MHITEANPNNSQRFVRSKDGIRLAYRVDGPEGPPTVLVPGWMVSGAVYAESRKLLTSDGLRTVVCDLRGSGNSDKPASGYTLERYAEDVITVLDQEKIDRAVLVGHSMGGQIAQLIAANHPKRVRGLVLLCPVPARGMALPEEAKQLFRGSGGNRTSQQTILDMACKQLSEKARGLLLDDAASIPEACIRDAFDAWSSGGFEDKLARIEAPTLVVATDDPFLPPAFIKETIVLKIRRARLVYLPGPGHYVQVERPQETAALLGAFLAGMEQ